MNDAAIGTRTVLRDLQGLLTVDVAHFCDGIRGEEGRGVSSSSRWSEMVALQDPKKMSRSNLGPGIIQVVCAGRCLAVA